MGCSCCQQCDRVSMRDPHAMMIAGEASTIGKLLPTFVTPGAVRAQKDRLNPAFVSTDADVQRCGAFPPEKRAAWSLFFSSWVHYRDQDESFWSVTSEFDAGTVFEKALQGWQTEVAASCQLSAPRVVTVDDAGPDLSAVKWAAAAVIVGAAVYAARLVLK